MPNRQNVDNFIFFSNFFFKKKNVKKKKLLRYSVATLFRSWLASLAVGLRTLASQVRAQRHSRIACYIVFRHRKTLRKKKLKYKKKKICRHFVCSAFCLSTFCLSTFCLSTFCLHTHFCGPPCIYILNLSFLYEILVLFQNEYWSQGGFPSWAQVAALARRSCWLCSAERGQSAHRCLQRFIFSCKSYISTHVFAFNLSITIHSPMKIHT